VAGRKGSFVGELLIGARQPEVAASRLDLGGVHARCWIACDVLDVLDGRGYCRYIVLLLYWFLQDALVPD
jgi:hypothetical protein